MDKTQACPVTPSTVLGSCAGACGSTAGSAYGGMCFCDSSCVDRGDCCLDAGMLCDVQMSGSSFPMMPGAIIDRTFCTERPAACRAVEHMYSIDINWP